MYAEVKWICNFEESSEWGWEAEETISYVLLTLLAGGCVGPGWAAVSTTPCVTMGSLYKQCWLLHTHTHKKKETQKKKGSKEFLARCHAALSVSWLLHSSCVIIFIYKCWLWFSTPEKGDVIEKCRVWCKAEIWLAALHVVWAWILIVWKGIIKKKRWNSLATKAHSPEVKVILLFRSCFWKGGEGPALAFCCSYLWKHPGECEVLHSGAEGALRPCSRWDPEAGELQAWLDVHWHMEAPFPPGDPCCSPALTPMSWCSCVNDHTQSLQLFWSWDL